MQCLVVGLAGQLGVDVAEVFVGDGVGRMRPDRHFEGGACLVVLLLLGVENGKVVVRLGQLRIVFGELGENADGVGRTVQFGKDQPLEKAPLRVLRARAQVGVDFFERLRELPLLDQALDFGQIVGKGGGGKADGQADRQCAQRFELPETRLVQGLRGHRYATILRVVQSSDSIKKLACSIDFSSACRFELIPTC